ncbi:MAG: hypothetical protein PHP98_03295 [Kiritimatiellae bacterium]|nr:hypothetical protein [Kiritimatiellia bacterium]
MKSLFRVSFLIAIVAVLAGPAHAASLSGAGTRETLITQEYLGFLTIGADYQQQERDISIASQGELRLKSQTFDGYIGVDPCQWMVIFATFGGTAAKTTVEETYNDSKFKWSAGFDVSWWRYSLKNPAFMAGDLSLKTHAEFAAYRSGSGAEKINWNEIFAALLVNYEVFVLNKGDMAKYPYSLALYAGPALSWLEGDCYAGGDAGRKTDFHEANLAGIIAGAEIFAAPNVSFGGAFQYYDAMTFNLGVRYHF